tara:strand:- start:159 stop:623 length:465 start_codon:yes stop_codon:yes gene_type:complete
MNKELKNLSKEEIYEYQQNRDPYLFIDFVTKLIPGKISEGYLNLDKNLWFFKVHWPEDPNMPGMLQIEALVQLSALTILSKQGNKGKLVYLINTEKCIFKKKILPGKKLEMKTKLISYKRGIGLCEGSSYVDGEKVNSAKFTITFPDDMIKMPK